MTVRIATVSIATVSIMTVSITTVSIMTVNTMTVSIMTVSIMTVSIKTVSIMTVSIIIKNATLVTKALSIDDIMPSFFILIVVMLSVIYDESQNLAEYADSSYTGCHNADSPIF
jgi:hypothetical protein